MILLSNIPILLFFILPGSAPMHSCATPDAFRHIGQVLVPLASFRFPQLCLP